MASQFAKKLDGPSFQVEPSCKTQVDLAREELQVRQLYSTLADLKTRRNALSPSVRLPTEILKFSSSSSPQTTAISRAALTA
jgi:hypothetical protein